MNFSGIVCGCLGPGLQGALHHGQVLSVLVHNILVSRGPMYRIREWAKQIEPEALGLTAAQVDRLNDDRIVRSLDALASERGRSLFFRLALRVIKDFELRTPRVHFDTTTVTLYGQYAGSVADPRITYGFNKDHRPDLKQLLFGLNITSDGAVPILHHVFSGNRTDDTLHVRNLDELRVLLGKNDFVYVADCKLCTTQNLEHVASYGGSFVTVLPRTRKEDQEFRARLRAGDHTVRWRKIHEIPNRRRRDDPPDVFSSTNAGPCKTKEGYRLVWIRSSHKAEEDRRVRMERIRKAEVELLALAPKIGRRALKTPRAIRSRVADILAARQVADFLEVKLIPFVETEHRYIHAGRPGPTSPAQTIRHRRFRLRVERQHAKLRQEAHTDGVFPLVTNLDDLSRKAILEIYKYQPYIEKRFSYTKTDYGVAPIFLKKPLRVVALLHVYFVAIMLAALLERQVRTAMKTRRIHDLPILPEGRETATPTAPRILENFTNAAWHEYEKGDDYVNFPVELSKTQRLLLQLADIPETSYV
jgi:transposase